MHVTVSKTVDILFFAGVTDS